MPILYLEIMEKLISAELNSGKQPMKMKVEVASKTVGLEHLSTLESFFVGRSYAKRLHTCNHDIGAPCVVEEL
jgi:hypothetical protein